MLIYSTVKALNFMSDLFREFCQWTVSVKVINSNELQRSRENRKILYPRNIKLLQYSPSNLINQEHQHTKQFYMSKARFSFHSCQFWGRNTVTIFPRLDAWTSIRLCVVCPALKGAESSIWTLNFESVKNALRPLHPALKWAEVSKTCRASNRGKTVIQICTGIIENAKLFMHFIFTWEYAKNEDKFSSYFYFEHCFIKSHDSRLGITTLPFTSWRLGPREKSPQVLGVTVMWHHFPVIIDGLDGQLLETYQLSYIATWYTSLVSLHLYRMNIMHKYSRFFQHFYKFVQSGFSLIHKPPTSISTATTGSAPTSCLASDSESAPREFGSISDSQVQTLL